MWAWLASLAAWILRLVADPHVRAATDILGAIVASLPNGFVARCIVLVKEAATNDKFQDAAERYSYVFDTLKAEYPDLASSTLNAAINMLYEAFKKGHV